ncbi:DUF2851 family protein [Ascidiimonas sp. W6]|uniref:DUF2851 family protein n=1 Tax=Ascidiimonas meishanensis TaxID=3128903 RepID=UPI0030ED5F08
MKEDFLHYLWKFGKFQKTNLCTASGEDVIIYAVGEHNDNSGPDFFNSKLLIGDQLWAGNVEIHLKSSDWYLHNHEKDSRYNNVILHVVWEHDIEVFRSDETVIPTLELQHFTDVSFLDTYTNFIEKKRSFVLCENAIETIDEFLITHWKDQLFVKRLEHKTVLLLEELKNSNNDWETVLFKILLKNFGLKVNGQSFYEISQVLDFKIIRKVREESEVLESLFFGCAGLLEETEVQDGYHEVLKHHFDYLQKKYIHLKITPVKPLFFRLRPANFPTIRLSQIAQLYHKHASLFATLMEARSVDEFYKIFDVGVADYWKYHYTWNKKSAFHQKRLTRGFIDLLIINTIIPLKFCYRKAMGFEEYSDILNLISSLTPEKNSIVEKFRKLGVSSKSALESQAILQLYNGYCQHKKCLECAIGNQLLTH